MRRKIYLQPRTHFDECISSETDTNISYNAQNIIAMLAAKFASEDEVKLDEMDYVWMAQEWFDYNIEPLQNHYSVDFIFEKELYEHS
jgi:prenyltransferase beta subunit